MHRNNLESQRHLTLREHQILKLVAIGLTAKEIAIEVGIAPRSIERHIENVCLKLNSRNRAHMILNAVHLGLLKIESRPPDEPFRLMPSSASDRLQRIADRPAEICGGRRKSANPSPFPTGMTIVIGDCRRSVGTGG